MPGLRLCALLASPLVLDVATQTLGLHDGNNLLRFATGLGFGFFSLIGSLRWLAARAELARSGRVTFLERDSST
jgi:uncharacterized membrane protein